MPMLKEWYDDAHTIIKITIAADSTWDEYHEAVAWIVEEVGKVAHRVDIIFYEEVRMPAGNPMPHLKWGSEEIIKLANTGHTAIVSPNSGLFIRSLMSTITKLFLLTTPLLDESRRLGFFPDMQSALAFIDEGQRVGSVVE